MKAKIINPLLINLNLFNHEKIQKSKKKDNKALKKFNKILKIYKKRLNKNNLWKINF